MGSLHWYPHNIKTNWEMHFDAGGGLPVAIPPIALCLTTDKCCTGWAWHGCVVNWTAEGTIHNKLTDLSENLPEKYRSTEVAYAVGFQTNISHIFISFHSYTCIKSYLLLLPPLLSFLNILQFGFLTSLNWSCSLQSYLKSPLCHIWWVFLIPYPSWALCSVSR